MESASGIKYTMFGRKKVDHDPLEENLAFLHSVMELCADAIKSGTLRDIVEKFQVSSKGDDVTITWDGRRLDSREAVMEWLAEVATRRAEDAAGADART